MPPVPGCYCGHSRLQGPYNRGRGVQHLKGSYLLWGCCCWHCSAAASWSRPTFTRPSASAWLSPGLLGHRPGHGGEDGGAVSRSGRRRVSSIWRSAAAGSAAGLLRAADPHAAGGGHLPSRQLGPDCGEEGVRPEKPGGPGQRHAQRRAAQHPPKYLSPVPIPRRSGILWGGDRLRGPGPGHSGQHHPQLDPETSVRPSRWPTPFTL